MLRVFYTISRNHDAGEGQILVCDVHAIGTGKVTLCKAVLYYYHTPLATITGATRTPHTSDALVRARTLPPSLPSVVER